MRYFSLDCWRGIACLLVIAYHAAHYGYLRPANGPRWAELVVSAIERGWIGVPLFFVISGYCIVASADRHRREDDSVARYFYRRFRRIYPPYWAFLTLAVPFLLLSTHVEAMSIVEMRGVIHPSTLTWRQWLGTLTLTETWMATLASDYWHFAMGHAWSLAYEEQFYAITGLILLILPRRIFAGAAIVTYGSIVAYTILLRSGYAVEGFFFDGLWMAFASGIWVYWVRNYCGSRKYQFLAVLIALPVVVWVLRHPTKVLSHGYEHSNDAFLASAIAFSILLAALSPIDRQVAALKLLRPFGWCGRMCYSLYLTHFPVTLMCARLIDVAGYTTADSVVLYTVPVSILMSVLVAWPFHLFIERRFFTFTENPGLMPFNLSRPRYPVQL